jgi:hypothetical protein
MHAVGSMLVRVSEPPAAAVLDTRRSTALVPARAPVSEAVIRAAARGERYGWPFTIVVVQFDGADASSVDHVVGMMWQRLRTGDEMHHYRQDTVALILPAMPNDSLPEVLARVTARAAALHFGVANSPLEGTDGLALLSLAEDRLADASARA